MDFTNEQYQRYSRHFVLNEIGTSGQKLLSSSSVLVIGAGALGSAALLYLAAAGIGTIGIADYDRVDISNLQRQIIHSTASIGVYKAESAARTIAALNPDVKTIINNMRVSPDNINELISDYDMIIDASDNFETKLLINDACVINKKPFVHGGVVRLEGQVMTYVPGEGPCFRCVIGEAPPRDQIVNCAQAGVLGSVTGILGSIQATEAVKYIIGKGELLTGRLLAIDALSMTFSEFPMAEPNPSCRVCGANADIRDVAASAKEYEEKFSEGVN